MIDSACKPRRIISEKPLDTILADYLYYLYYNFSRKETTVIL